MKISKSLPGDIVERKHSGRKKNDGTRDVVKNSPMSIWSCKAFRFFL